MKGTARLITSSLRASAKIVGGIAASAWAIPDGIEARAHVTDNINIYKYLCVTPSEPQQLVWLVPQYGIDYTIESNTNWNIK